MAEIYSMNTYPSIIEGWTINPENNIVPAYVLKELQKNNFFNTQHKLCKYKIKSNSTDSVNTDLTTKPRDKNSQIVAEIMQMKPAEAKRAILGDKKENKGLLDIWVLKKLQKDDMRSGIQSAVEKQIAVLYHRPDEEEK